MHQLTTLMLIVFSIIQSFSQTKKTVWKVKNASINNNTRSFGASFYSNNKVVFSATVDNKLHLYSGTIVQNDIKNKTLFLANKTHESNVTFTNDLQTMYFTRSLYGTENTIYINNNKKETIAIFKATRTRNGKWGNITSLPFNNLKYDVGHPTLNKENTKLYFSSNRKGSIGKSDLFVVTILGENKYSKPKNLGNVINSKKNELHPYVSKDNILYFSSNGHNGFGGLDIYAVDLNAKNPTLKHLESPINTPFDDFSYSYDKDINLGFLSSNRPNGKGSDDIYVIYKGEKTEKITTKNNECTQLLTGVVFMNNTQTRIPNALVQLKDLEDNIISNIHSNKNAQFSFRLKCKNTFNIEALKTGFTKNKMVVSSYNENNMPIRRNIFLTPIKNNEKSIRTLKIGEIGFNYNESKLYKRYIYQLDKAILRLINNPKLTIQIESHTDCRAEDAYNMKLSEDRIFIITEYLTKKGIANRRIRGVAYGETKPLNNCVNGVKCTEEEFLLNRRTIFKIK